MAGGGFTAGLTTNRDPLSGSVEFLASQHYMVKRGGITLDASAFTADENGDKIVRGGTVLYLNSSTGKYSATAGTTGDDAKAKGLLFAGDLNVRDGDTVAGLLIHGSVLEARCTGVTDTVKTDLGDRIIFQ